LGIAALRAAIPHDPLFVQRTQMENNSPGMALLGGLAALGVAVAAGLWLRRRRKAGETRPPEDPPGELKPETELEEGPATLGESASGRMDPVGEYFVLVTALTVPFWIYGGRPLPLPVKLPASALALVVPLAAACILTYRRAGPAGLRALFRRVLDYSKIQNKAWYLPILLIYPLIAVLSYLVMRRAGLPLPEPQVPWLMTPLFLAGFFIAGIGEELGWMGYAFDPMQRRWGALGASLLLGLFWAVYHLIPDLQNGQPAGWILWHRLGTVAFRVLIAWVYTNTGRSVFTAVLFHAVNNLCWALFPNYGSHYNPFVNFLLTLPALGFVLLGWDWRTLTRYRFARGPSTVPFNAP